MRENEEVLIERSRRNAVDCNAGPVHSNSGLIMPIGVVLADAPREMMVDAQMSLSKIVVAESYLGQIEQSRLRGMTVTVNGETTDTPADFRRQSIPFSPTLFLFLLPPLFSLARSQSGFKRGHLYRHIKASSILNHR